MTDEQFDRLPSYAKTEITRLRANAQHNEKRLRAMAHDGDTPWTLESGMPEDVVKLPPDSQVRYRLNAHDWVQIHARPVAGGKHRLELYANDTLVIMPNSSNVVTVEVRR